MKTINTLKKLKLLKLLLLFVVALMTLTLSLPSSAGTINCHYDNYQICYNGLLCGNLTIDAVLHTDANGNPQYLAVSNADIYTPFSEESYSGYLHPAVGTSGVVDPAPTHSGQTSFAFEFYSSDSSHEWNFYLDFNESSIMNKNGQAQCPVVGNTGTTTSRVHFWSDSNANWNGTTYYIYSIAAH